MRKRRLGSWLGIVLWVAFILYCALPLIATALFSLSSRWVDTALPEGFNVDSYRQMLAEAQFLPSLMRSTVLAIGTLAIVAVLCILLLTWVHIRAP